MNLLSHNSITGLLNLRILFILAINIALMHYVVKIGKVDLFFMEFFNLESFGFLSYSVLFVLELGFVAFARSFIYLRNNYERDSASLLNLEKRSYANDNSALIKKVAELKHENKMDNLFSRLCALGALQMIAALTLSQDQYNLFDYWQYWLCLVPIGIVFGVLSMAGLEPDKNDSTQFSYYSDLLNTMNKNGEGGINTKNL